jgi:hypothetical protein
MPLGVSRPFGSGISHWGWARGWAARSRRCLSVSRGLLADRQHNLASALRRDVRDVCPQVYVGQFDAVPEPADALKPHARIQEHADDRDVSPPSGVAVGARVQHPSYLVVRQHRYRLLGG